MRRHAGGKCGDAKTDGCEEGRVCTSITNQSVWEPTRESTLRARGCRSSNAEGRKEGNRRVCKRGGGTNTAASATSAAPRARPSAILIIRLRKRDSCLPRMRCRRRRPAAASFFFFFFFFVVGVLPRASGEPFSPIGGSRGGPPIGR